MGVALWPAYYAGLTSTYPGTCHARLMIEGFMASFIIGFLGTAGPRITSSFHFSNAELLVLLMWDALASGLHFGNANRAGDLVFVLLIVVFSIVLGRRFVAGEDWPPPNFALVALGILNGAAGALLLASNENRAYAPAYRIGAALLEQGFVLLPILGVAPFFLARLLERSSEDGLPNGRAIPPGWIGRAIIAAGIGLTIDGTLIAEAVGLTSAAALVRFVIVTVWLAARLPWRGRSFLADLLRLALGAIVIGIASAVVMPQARVGALHITFISGFALVVLTVATRVVLGHAGLGELFKKPLPFLISTALLLEIAALSRFVAEAAPSARAIHLVAAAICWLIAAGIWSAKVLPKVRLADQSPQS